MDFVHLHVHTEYSLLDGACRITRLVERAKALGQKAVAITDHGAMYGAVEFYKACVKADVRPIIGCEVYVAPRGREDREHRLDGTPYHLVLLCENAKGYENLIKLVSLGFTEGFYGKPRVDRELLTKHHEGLICLSACLSGEVNRRLTERDARAALEAARWYRDTFGAENYFIELQNHGLEEQQSNLPGLTRIARQLGVGLVATNDCHYIEREDAKTQKVLLCIQTNHTLNDEDAVEFPNDEFFVKSGDEMAALFADYPEAVANTVKIAERCRFDFVFHELKLPYFRCPEPGTDNLTFFRRLCAEGLRRHYGDDPPQNVRDRLEYETSVVAKMGFVDYYLIVWDFIHYAKTNGIPVGPGRGSGAGSLCAYCMGITGIDPVRYNLLFERFLNPERVSMPDFDIDFCYVRRQEVIDYVVRHYGSDHVAQIITFGTMAARAAIRDVGRVMGLPYQATDAVAKLVPRYPGVTLESALAENGKLRELYGADAQVRELIDTAGRLEGFPRHASTHAAGVVITRERADCYVPLQKNDEAVVTQYTMKALEELGLLKMDFLGLRNLTVIADTERFVRRAEPAFAVERIPLDDPLVYEQLSQGRTEGVFQFEASGVRNLLVQMKPRVLEDLIAATSLYRPGPMDSIPTYIENRANPANIRYAHPKLREILDVTYGCIIYQEQVMQIFRALAGYSYGRADIVRRAMAKKQHEVMERERQVFLYGNVGESGAVECCGAIANGMSESDANKLFDEMAGFASYAFNKSHAAAYGLLAYQTAYLRAHYPKPYWAALLTSVLDYTPKVTEYIAECARVGIKTLPPDVNESYESFTAEAGGIRFGLLAVKNVGANFVRSLIAEREAGGRFETLYSFLYRAAGRDFNRKTAESLIRAGALDGFGYNRRELLMGYDALMDRVDARRKFEGVGQVGFFTDADAPEDEPLPRMEDFAHGERMRMEKETTGLYISGHPLGAYRALSDRIGADRIGELVAEDDESRWPDGAGVVLLGLMLTKKEKTSKNGGRMAFVEIEDETGQLELIVFPQVYTRYGGLFQPDQPLVVLGKLSVREDEDKKVLVDTILRADDPAASGVKRPAQRQSAQQWQPIPQRIEPETMPAEPPKPPVRPAEPPPRLAAAPPIPPVVERGLFLRVPSREDAVFAKAVNLLEIFEGSTPVYFRFADTGKMLAAPRSMWAAVCPVLLSELARVCGAENVALR